MTFIGISILDNFNISLVQMYQQDLTFNFKVVFFFRWEKESRSFYEDHVSLTEYSIILWGFFLKSSIWCSRSFELNSVNWSKIER